MKKIKLLRSCGIRGQGYEAGQVLDVEDDDARILLEMKRAEIVVVAEFTTEAQGPRQGAEAESPQSGAEKEEGSEKEQPVKMASKGKAKA